VARDVGADVVVVASKRASGLLGLLLGSTARGVLRASLCPVLVVRPDWACADLSDTLALEVRAPEEGEGEARPGPRVVPDGIPDRAAQARPLAPAG
jgi:hypothetical protein